MIGKEPVRGVQGLDHIFSFVSLTFLELGVFGLGVGNLLKGV